MVGAILGWPHLDVPSPGSEGLGWKPHDDCFEYSKIGVKLPRLDDARKANYLTSVPRYDETGGQFFAVDDVTGEIVQLITEKAADAMREASWLASRMPRGSFLPIGLDDVILQPGARAVFPWSGRGMCPQGFAVVLTLPLQLAYESCRGIPPRRENRVS